MKKSILLFGCSLMTMYGFSQSSTSGGIGHQRTNTRYLGWSPGIGSIPGPLDIRNDFNEPITLHTNGVQRMVITPNGLVGMGNGFNNPQSLLHLNNPTNQGTWFQITDNVTGLMATDGLRLGVFDANLYGYSIPSGYLRWNEDSPFIIQTASNNGSNINDSERLRISTNDNHPNPDPFNPEGNITRIGISHKGDEHIEVIRSLLHLGYNTGRLLTNNTISDGWRNWMDIGTFTNNGGENMYVGLKQEATEIIGLLPDPSARFDAVINWGDNELVPSDGRYNNLRFIYTTPETTTNNQPHTAWNGLETMRIEPTLANTLAAPNFGMVGIGDFSPEGPNTNGADVVNAKLDIDGDLRIRTVTKDTTLLQVLVIDSTDHNRVHWRSVVGLGSVTANNGVSVNATTGAVQLGVKCNSTLPVITANAFTDDRVVPIGNFNLWFATYTGDKGGIGIGGQPASTPFCGTGNTLEISANGASKYGTAISSGLRFTKLKSTDTPLPNGTNGIDNTKVLSVDQDGDVVLVDAVGDGVGNYCTSTQNPLTSNYEIPLHNNDFYFQDLSGTGRVFLGDVYCGSSSDSRVYIRNNSTTSGWQNGLSVQSIDPNGIGGYFEGDLYGIKAESMSSNLLSRAGYFNGILETTAAAVITSDKMLKTNVENIKGATDVLRKLKPHTYKMDVTGFPQFNFQDRLQYGFIAQEVADVLPNLVHDSYMPSKVDSLGNEISPAVNYKSLNYNGLIPITVQAVNEITERIDKSTLSDQNVKTNVQNLTNSLDKVKQMRGVTYEWNSTAQNNMNLDSSQHIGFIAQEIAAIEPLLTFVDDSSLVHVNYDRVVPLLVESVKELDGKVQSKDSIIENLETRLAYLENCIRNANICTEGNRTMNTEPDNNTNYKSIELTNVNSIILDQNLPNPFKENTVINYNIPAEVVEAKLLFYDLYGRIIKELIIEERGESKLTVYGTNLKTGIYTYSFIADGELIATKKMVKK